MKTNGLYMTIRQTCGAASGETFASFVLDSLNESAVTPDLLCYCHQSAGLVWEAPCAKLRAGLGLQALFPLSFGQSGALSFSHALELTEWLLAAGTHRGALFAIVEGGPASEPGGIHEFQVAIAEISPEKGTYRLMPPHKGNVDVRLKTGERASAPLLALKDRERTITQGTAIELVFRDGNETRAIALCKE